MFLLYYGLESLESKVATVSLTYSTVLLFQLRDFHSRSVLLVKIMVCDAVAPSVGPQANVSMQELTCCMPQTMVMDLLRVYVHSSVVSFLNFVILINHEFPDNPRSGSRTRRDSF
jgi:hypothetical protein